MPRSQARCRSQSRPAIEVLLAERAELVMKRLPEAIERIRAVLCEGH